jgi:hypothetical protein
VEACRLSSWGGSHEKARSGPGVSDRHGPAHRRIVNRVTSFEREADEIRRTLHIPGTRGYGYADLENRVPATPDTLFHIAPVTKPRGATLVMQLAPRCI